MYDQATDIGVLETEITSNRATLTAYPDYVVACDDLADPLRRTHARTGNIDLLNDVTARESWPARLEREFERQTRQGEHELSSHRNIVKLAGSRRAEGAFDEIACQAWP
jgi:hypothetical protein